MQRTRFGQGLAVSAVSALVITGLAMTAPAAQAADGGGVRLLSQQDGVASVRRDADAFFGGATVTLAAERLDPDATITFEYNADPAAGDSDEGWTALGAVTMRGPYASLEWDAAGVVGTSVALRAVATVAATESAPETRTYSTRNGVAVTGGDSPVNSVALGVPNRVTSGEMGGFFVQPYADSGRTATLLAVAGNTSATTGSVELSAWNAVAGVFQGQTAAAVQKTEFKTSPPFEPNPTYVDGGYFLGVLDIAALDLADGDVLALRAERDSDSVVPVTLVDQTIGLIASQGTTTGPETTEHMLVVRDPEGRAVTGAEVRRASDGGLVGYTDALGVVLAEQANGTDETYYANTTDVDAFEDGVDVSTGTITAPEYVPVATSTEAVLADGDVFDDQEYADGDITLQVLDAYGLPFEGEEDITYDLYPSDGTPPSLTPVTTDADGTFVVPFDPNGPDGDYTLSFTAPASEGGADEEPVTFTAGDAVLGLSPAAGTATSGGTITYTGTLTVEGKALAGRDVDLDYSRGTEQAPGTAADAGLLVGSDRVLHGAVGTTDDGTFTVKVGDPAETGNPAETGGRLTVTARGLGDTAEATADFTAGPPPVVADDTDEASEPATVRLRLGGKSVGAKDRLRVRGPRVAAGARIKVQAKVGGRWRVVKRATLNRKGDRTVTLRDRNGAKVTRYRVKMMRTEAVARARTKVLRLR